MVEGILIQKHFDDWKQDLLRVKKLLNQNEYYLEAILILSCYIGALTSWRYTNEKDGDAYKKIVLNYSGRNKISIYKKIDLLFFYQWPKSNFKDHGSYKELKSYREIKNILLSVFGDENKIRDNNRFVAQKTIMGHILSNPFKGLDRKIWKDVFLFFLFVKYYIAMSDAMQYITSPFH